MNHKTVFTGVETSPWQAEEEKLRLLKEFYVNRISIGIQSFVREELWTLRRNQDTAILYKALEQIKKAEFDSMNLDLWDTRTNNRFLAIFHEAGIVL